MAREFLRIGCGAGMADDRIPPAVELVERAELDVLVFECLAERTIARETRDRLKNPALGYTPGLRDRMAAVLPGCLSRGIRIVTNMGAANPRAAAALVHGLAVEMGLSAPRIAIVTGDDVTETVRTMADAPTLEDGRPLGDFLPFMASANAYLGATAIRDALAGGADIVITGRVADPSLFLGPAMWRFGWSETDWDKLALGTIAGHLLECSGQLTGGCFADPGVKDVPDLAGLGYPFADIWPDGRLELGKCPETGGRLDRATCTEQLLYEIHDPAAYVTPDCVLDVTDVDFVQLGPDRVRVIGTRGHPRTESLKVVVGYEDGYIGIGEMGYAGINAVARARLGAEVVLERLRRRGFSYPEMKVDLIGVTSLHGDIPGRPEPYEVRLRVAGRNADRAAAAAIGAEVRSLHMQGPTGGGGGYSLGVTEVLAVRSLLVERSMIRSHVEFV